MKPNYTEDMKKCEKKLKILDFFYKSQCSNIHEYGEGYYYYSNHKNNLCQKISNSLDAVSNECDQIILNNSIKKTSLGK